MKILVALAVGVALLTGAPAFAGDITGQYIEARTCDVWTAACFANAEMNLTGKHAVIGWKVDKGSFDNVALGGLSVVAVVEATDTLGLEQTGAAKAVLLVDERATAAQRRALEALARKLGGDLTKNIVKVESKPIRLAVHNCKAGGCAKLDAGVAKIETRCIDAHDKVCGNEEPFYAPLAAHVKADAAYATEHSFVGAGFDKSWKEMGRRGAYIGTFSAP